MMMKILTCCKCFARYETATAVWCSNSENLAASSWKMKVCRRTTTTRSSRQLLIRQLVYHETSLPDEQPLNHCKSRRHTNYTFPACFLASNSLLQPNAPLFYCCRPWTRSEIQSQSVRELRTRGPSETCKTGWTILTCPLVYYHVRAPPKWETRKKRLHMLLLLPTPMAVEGSGFYVRLSVSVGFSARYFKNDAATIIKLDTEMFLDESWKSMYFGSKGLKVKVVSHKNIAGVGLYTLLSAGFFSFKI